MTKKITGFLLLLLMTAGCLDEPDCYLLNNNFVGISFKKLEDSTADTVAFSGFGTVDPSILFSGDTTLTRIYLPLNYFRDETSFFFDTPDRMLILRLGYISQAQFVSEKCGEKFVLSELNVLRTSFDSVRLVTNTPTRDGTAINIEIFQ